MENPEIEPLHHHHTGRPRLDLVLGIRKALLDASLKRATIPPHPRVHASDVVHRVLSAKETIPFVDFSPLQEYTTADYAAITEGVEKPKFLSCYCSVFDECWTLDSTKPRPSKFNACPVSGISFERPE